MYDWNKIEVAQSQFRFTTDEVLECYFAGLPVWFCDAMFVEMMPLTFPKFVPIHEVLT